MPALHARTVARLEAPSQRVLDACREVLGAVSVDDATLTAPVPGVGSEADALRVSVRRDGDLSVAHLHGRIDIQVPYFGWIVHPVLRAGLRRGLRIAASRVRASVEGSAPPRPPREIPFTPPVAFAPQQAVFIACVAMATALASFGGSLQSQMVHFYARSFEATDQALGVALAASRAGVLLGLVASALADRRGRRIMLLVSLTGICVGNAVSAVAPDLATFTAGQVVVRGLSSAAFAVGGIAAVEEAPEGGRAYTVAILSLAGGFGFTGVLIMLPVGDLAGQAWRIGFALSAAAGLLIPGLARRMNETRRYTSLTAGVRRGRVMEVIGRTYGSRFAILVAVAFLGAVFGTPGAQFRNRYLAEVHAFSGLDIAVLLAVTGAPGFFGLLVGGRLAESFGRRPIAVAGMLTATLAQIAFFLVGGPPLWLAAAATAFLGGMLVPVLGALGVELFSTEIRGTANGFLLVAGVAGAVIGLIAAGALAGMLPDLGRAVALLGIVGLLAVPLLPLLPESAFKTLDEISPTQAGAPDDEDVGS